MRLILNLRSGISQPVDRHQWDFTGTGWIGRDIDCDIVLQNMGVSRRHAQLLPLDEGFGLLNNGANPTLINGIDIPKGSTQPLRSGDEIEIVDCVFDVIVAAESAHTSAYSKNAQKLDDEWWKDKKPEPDIPTPIEPSAVRILEAAGLDRQKLDSTTFENFDSTVGEIVRIVTEGLHGLLRARAAVKGEFRVPQTEYRASDNNPLKKSKTSKEALGVMFLRSTPGYMEPADAFAEALSDIKSHEVAMMIGMRAAFMSLMERFDPDKLEAGFGAGNTNSGVLNKIGIKNYWDDYRQFYARMTADENMTARQFMAKFAEAYERHLQDVAESR